MKTYHRIINLVSNTIFLFTIILMFIAIFYDNRINEAPIGSFDTIAFNDGWILEKDGQTEAITFPYSEDGFLNKHIVLRNSLPEDIRDGMTLSFRSDLSDIRIFIGDEEKAYFGEESVGYVGYYPPSAYEFVQLTDEDAGKEIRLEILTKKKTGYFEGISIGYGNNGWFGIIRNNIVEMVMSILMIVIGFIAIIFYYIVRNKVKINRSIQFLGQTIMMLGIWIISESRLRQLIFKMPSITQIICYISLEVLVVYVFFYFDEIQDKYYHKVYVILETFNLGQLVINMILSYLRVVDLHDSLKYSHIWIGASLVPVIILLIKDIINARIKKYRISAFGMFAFLLASLGEIISYYVSTAQNLGIFVCIGLVVLLGATIMQTLIDAYNLEKESRKHVEKATMTTIETIASAIDARDEYTGGHSERVAYYATILAEKIAKEYDLSEADVKRIHYIALMHDIGKIGIPDAILNKPSKLTDEEFVLMKQHAEIGDGLLKEVDTVEGLSDGVRHHHERYDGKGYPDGLAGDEIPLVAKILCIADCFDAMTSNRIYRKRLSDEQVRAELEKCAGSQFDPQLVKVFCELLDSSEITVQPQKGISL